VGAGRTRAPIYRGGLIGLLHVERDRTRDAAIGSPELHKGDLYHHVPLPSSAAALSGGCCQCTVIKCEGLFTKVSVSPGNTLYPMDDGACAVSWGLGCTVACVNVNSLTRLTLWGAVGIKLTVNVNS